MLQSADQVTGALAAWLRTSFAGVRLSLSEALLDDDTPVIKLKLAELHVESASNRVTPSTVLRLDYFITVAAADILLVHKYLGEIAFALAATPVLAVADAEPVILRMERSAAGLLGIAVSAALPRVRTQPSAPPVLFPPVVRVGEMGAIEGMVQAPDGGAVSGAVVEIPSLQLRQVTGPDGSFHFDAPSAARPLRLTARKQRFSQTVTAEIGQHLTLQLSLEN